MRLNATAGRVAPDGDIGILLDPQLAAEAKQIRERRLHTLEIPLLRAAGMGLLFLLVVVHQRVTAGGWLSPAIQFYGIALVVYCLVTWLLLTRYYAPRPSGPTLSDVVLALDFLPWVAAMHLTGGPDSWLFALLFVRVADRGHTSFQAALVFGFLSFLTYIIYLGWREWYALPVDWSIETGKLAAIVAINFYLSLAARSTAHSRDRMRRVVHYARMLIQQLEKQSVALRTATDEAEAASRMKSDFLANVSHELRTPMNAVIGTTGLLMETPLSHDQHDYTRIIHTSAEHLLGVINDILDLSKMDAGLFTLAPVTFSPRDTADEVVRVIQGHAARKGITLRSEVDTNVPAWCLGDAGRIRQVLLNLAQNGVKFTEHGHVTIRVGWVETDSNLRFDVLDTGIGLSPHAVDRVFEAFFQADGSPSRRYEGTGLGLAIAQRLVTLMEGRLGVHSHEGRGSHFWFTIAVPETTAPESADAGHRPAIAVWDRPAPAPPEGTRPAASDGTPRPSRGVVLIAEDNEMNQLVMRRMIERLGFTAALAPTGREAVQTVAERGDINLVLMDCQMPDMDGFEATRAIRQMEGSRALVPIVAVTATAMADLYERCMVVGMNDCLPKPVRLGELTEIVERWAGRGLTRPTAR